MKYNKTFQRILAGNYFVFILFTMLHCAKNEEKSKDISVNRSSATNTYFKGVIKLDEKDVLGVNSRITITLNGDDVKREVQESQATVYGMIYKKDEDSVLYYYKKENQFFHTAIFKKDFKVWVSKLEKPQTTTETWNESASLKEPFGTIFLPFESYLDIILLNTTKVDLKNYGSASMNTYTVGTDLIANVWYSEAIKVRPQILQLLEYNQPTTITTLPLQVFYVSPKNKVSSDLSGKILSKLNRVTVKLKRNSQFNSINTTENIEIELPLNSKKISILEMGNMISPPDVSNGKRRHHHHDFF